MAQATLSVCQSGRYVTPSGVTITIEDSVRRAIEGTVLYRPRDLDALPVPGGARPFGVEVTPETTFAAARRLIEVENCSNVLALNFASARRVGGGFLGGAKAQEEDLCRASALYPCLETHPKYYEANRSYGSSLYTHHAIWSPDVPVFRDERHAFLEQPFCVSILTMPAPNRAHLDSEGASIEELRATFHRRTLAVLQIAAHRHHRVLVLGAWGCGAFRNDPEMAVCAFEAALEQTRGAFERVVFAVYERSDDGPNRRAFQRLAQLR